MRNEARRATDALLLDSTAARSHRARHPVDDELHRQRASTTPSIRVSTTLPVVPKRFETRSAAR